MRTPSSTRRMTPVARCLQTLAEDCRAGRITPQVKNQLKRQFIARAAEAQRRAATPMQIREKKRRADEQELLAAAPPPVRDGSSSKGWWAGKSNARGAGEWAATDSDGEEGEEEGGADADAAAAALAAADISGALNGGSGSFGVSQLHGRAGFVDLARVTKLVMPGENGAPLEASSAPLGLELHTPNRVWQLAAETVGSRSRWAETLRAAIATARWLLQGWVHKRGEGYAGSAAARAIQARAARQPRDAPSLSSSGRSSAAAARGSGRSSTSAGNASHGGPTGGLTGGLAATLLVSAACAAPATRRSRLGPCRR